MGFNKRYINFEKIDSIIKSEKSLSELFISDSLIFSDIKSFEVYSLFLNGLTKEEIINKTKYFD